MSGRRLSTHSGKRRTTYQYISFYYATSFYSHKTVVQVTLYIWSQLDCPNPIMESFEYPAIVSAIKMPQISIAD